MRRAERCMLSISTRPGGPDASFPPSRLARRRSELKRYDFKKPSRFKRKNSLTLEWRRRRTRNAVPGSKLNGQKQRPGVRTVGYGSLRTKSVESRRGEHEQVSPIRHVVFRPPSNVTGMVVGCCKGCRPNGARPL